MVGISHIQGFKLSEINGRIAWNCPRIKVEFLDSAASPPGVPTMPDSPSHSLEKLPEISDGWLADIHLLTVQNSLTLEKSNFRLIAVCAALAEARGKLKEVEKCAKCPKPVSKATLPIPGRGSAGHIPAILMNFYDDSMVSHKDRHIAVSELMQNILRYCQDSKLNFSACVPLSSRPLPKKTPGLRAVAALRISRVLETHYIDDDEEFESTSPAAQVVIAVLMKDIFEYCQLNRLNFGSCVPAHRTQTDEAAVVLRMEPTSEWVEDRLKRVCGSQKYDQLSDGVLTGMIEAIAESCKKRGHDFFTLARRIPLLKSRLDYEDALKEPMMKEHLVRRSWAPLSKSPFAWVNEHLNIMEFTKEDAERPRPSALSRMFLELRQYCKANGLIFSELMSASLIMFNDLESDYQESEEE